MPMAGMSNQPYVFAVLVLLGFFSITAASVIGIRALRRHRRRANYLGEQTPPSSRETT